MLRFRLRSHARKLLSSLVIISVAGAGIGLASTPAAAAEPVITSTDFPDGDVISPMVGEVGELTIDSPDDVVSYRVTFSEGGRVEDVEPESPGAPVTVSYMPRMSGRHLVSVSALHADGTGSSSSYAFRVSARGPVSSYDLSEAPGSDTAADGAGSNPGKPGSGVAFGVAGPKEPTAAGFDGGANAYISTEASGLVPTDEGFAAAAWVKIDDLGRDQTIVSVDGTEEAGFVLGYRSTSSDSGTWTLQVPGEDGDSSAHTVSGGVVSQTNHDQWVHVAGVYDDHERTMELYLNGRSVGTENRDSSWKADNTIQIGRSLHSGEYGRRLDGSLAEVRLFDRVVFAHETAHLNTIAPHRAAYWQLNANGAEYTGKSPLTLDGGASIYTRTSSSSPRPLMGAGHLKLDGETGFAHTGDTLVDTRLSFSVTTRVRLTDVTPGRDMTVFALPGRNANLVEVKYSAEADAWRLVVAKDDSASAETIAVDHGIAPYGSSGQAVSLTFDAFTGELVLWVNGEASQPLAFTTPWATTGIQLGRSGPGTGHLDGAIDDVRVYQGACDADLVNTLAIRSEQPNL